MRLATRLGHRLFRNNSGLAFYANGDPVKYGVASPGGSDLIGWTSIVVTPDMVGKRIARFLAVEVKSKHGRMRKEQTAFLRVVNEAGGIGIRCESEQQLATALHEMQTD